MDDFEKRLARMPLRKASDDLDARVNAQRPAVEQPMRIQWWRRRIAVPLPVAACIGLAFAVLLLWRVAPVGRPSSTESIQTSPAPAAAQRNYYEMAVYIPGAGAIYTEKNFKQD